MARLIDHIEGHERIWQRLCTLVEHARLPHAMAFVGPSGVGKRMMAWALAQLVVCEQRAEAPCGRCGPCLRVAKQESESVLRIEPQGVQGLIKLEAAHHVLEFLALRRLGRARLILIEDAQGLNPQAGNALLKVVEEPPPETHFVFVLPEISMLLPTLRSRCQVMRFGALPESVLRRFNEGAEEWMVRSSRGSVERLRQFGDSEAEELRQLAFALLRESALGRREALEQVLERTRDKASAVPLVRLLQELTRDWSTLEAQDLIHADLPWDELPPRGFEQRVELWQHAHRLEVDLAANVDRGLMFENFHYDLRGSPR